MSTALKYYSATFNVNWLQQRIDVTLLLFGDLALEAHSPDFHTQMSL